MKMKYTLLSLILFCAPIFVAAQEHTGIFGLHFQGSSLSKEFKPVSYGLELGYNFTNKLYAAARLDREISLFKKAGVKDYTRSYVIGLDAGYKVLTVGDTSVGVQVGSGVNPGAKSNEWKYVYYEGQLYFEIKVRSGLTPRFGVGVRYYDSHRDMYPNRTSVFGTIAFRINTNKM